MRGVGHCARCRTSVTLPHVCAPPPLCAISSCAATQARHEVLVYDHHGKRMTLLICDEHHAQLLPPDHRLSITATVAEHEGPPVDP